MLVVVGGLPSTTLQGTHSPFQTARPNTLMVLDLEGNGFAFTPPADGVLFTFDRTPAQRMAWVAINSDDAILVLDVDNNGRIDGAREMLGTRFRLTASGPEVTSGADALLAPLQGIRVSPDGRPLDMPPGAGVIDARDEVYSKLRLWRDLTRDGTVQPTELTSLEAAGVSAIRNGYRRVGSPDAAGNVVRLSGTFTVRVRGAEFERQLVEVEFAR